MKYNLLKYAENEKSLNSKNNNDFRINYILIAKLFVIQRIILNNETISASIQNYIKQFLRNEFFKTFKDLLMETSFTEMTNIYDQTRNSILRIKSVLRVKLKITSI